MGSGSNISIINDCHFLWKYFCRGFCSDRVSQTTVLKVETNIWAPMSTPALTRTKELEALQADVDTLSGPGEIVITTPEVGPWILLAQ